jgi:hypothetical protein
MLTMLACDPKLQDQLKSTGRYTTELQRKVAEEQATTCAAASKTLPAVCSAAKAAIGDIGNIDV